MKLRWTFIAAAFAFTASGASATILDEQEVDPERVAEMRCQWAGECGQVKEVEDGGIEGVSIRGGPSFRELLKNVRPSQAAVSSPQPRARVIKERAPTRVTGKAGLRGQKGGVAAKVTEADKEGLALLVTFARNSDRLLPQSNREIKGAVEALSKPRTDGSEIRLLIAGHTDATGEDEFNKDLSARRAKAVRDALIAAGAKPEQLETVGHGADKLKDSDNPNAAINRRVEAVLID